VHFEKYAAFLTNLSDCHLLKIFLRSFQIVGILAGEFVPFLGLAEPVLARENVAAPSITFSPDSTLFTQPLQLILKSTVKDYQRRPAQC
jgi:hypothetical protein